MTPVCHEARCTADPGARIEDCGLTRDADHVHQLGCGDAAHRVEVFQQREVGGLKIVEVFFGGNEGPLNVVPGYAGRVLSVDAGVCHVCSFGSSIARGSGYPGRVAGSPVHDVVGT